MLRHFTRSMSAARIAAMLVCCLASISIPTWAAQSAGQTAGRDAELAGALTRHAWPLFYTPLPNGGAVGGSRELIVRLEPSDAGDPRIGFFESEFFAAGEQWRAAGWMAGVVAALVSGQSLARWRVSYDVPGLIDGPSAGGLMTATLLSAFQGAEIRADTTMTGTINPDGSIGPVSGIYYKLQGARDAGKTRVLIPAGGRMEQEEDGHTVDLYQRGKELGVDVVEVADVYQAYAWLTGNPLPEEQDHGQAFKLPPRALQALEHSYGRWLAKFDEATERMRETAEQVPPLYRTKLGMFWDQAFQQKTKAEAAHGQGSLCAAMQLMFTAASIADGGAQLSFLYIGHGRGGLQGMIKALSGFLIQPEFLERFRAKLGEQNAANVTDLITLSEAFSYYNAALGTHLNSNYLLDNLERAPDEATQFQMLESATVGEATARNFFHFVDDLLYMGMGHPGPALPPAERLEDWAMAMYRAAGANLGYIQKTIVEPIADQFQLSPATVMIKLLGGDQHYTLANSCFQAVPRLMEQMEREERQSLAVLGGAVATFSLSAMVVMKYYCLGADLDEKGMVRGLQQPNLLAPMLGSAHKRLRQAILAAERQGATPVIPIFHLRSGLAVSGPGADVNDRLSALGEFWVGSTFGRLMSILGEK